MNKHRTFFAYVIPSVLAFALSGVYAIVDGFFIGNNLGDSGLSAINLAYPIAAFIQAVGTGIGLAGAIRFTILKAQGNKEGEKEYFSGTILLLALLSIIITVFIFTMSIPLLRLLGAKNDILSLANEYVAVIAIGAVFQIFGTGLVPFIRNLGGASFAMFAGFATNIGLDYLFVWVIRWGMFGAALATIIGQGVTLLAAVIFLLKNKVIFKIPEIKKIPGIFCSILLVSISPFGLTFSPNITLILMNRFLLLYGGDSAVATYACIAYITSIVYLLLQGIGDGSQPLISRYYGEKAEDSVKEARSLSYITGAAVALACMAGLFFTRTKIGVLFGASTAVSENVAAILPIFLTTLILLSFVRVTISYFYATEQSRLSYLLVYAEPLLLLALSMTLPPIAGLTGIWISVPIAQGLTWIIALTAKRKVDRL